MAESRDTTRRGPKTRVTVRHKSTLTASPGSIYWVGGRGRVGGGEEWVKGGRVGGEGGEEWVKGGRVGGEGGEEWVKERMLSEWEKEVRRKWK